MYKDFKKLSQEEMKNLSGGTSVEEYCETLHNMLLSGGYQGDLGWAFEVWDTNCSSIGITFPYHYVMTLYQ